MPIKMPIACLVILTISLALVNLVGLIRVEMDRPPPRLLLLFAFYLSLMWGIILIHKKILTRMKISVNCTSKTTEAEYEAHKKR
jgi:hypothetical protein